MSDVAGRAARYQCSNEEPRQAHQHTDGPDDYMYQCPGVVDKEEPNCFSCMAPHSKRFPCIWGV